MLNKTVYFLLMYLFFVSTSNRQLSSGVFYCCPSIASTVKKQHI